MAQGNIKVLHQNLLVGVSGNSPVWPVSSALAIYEDNTYLPLALLNLPIQDTHLHSFCFLNPSSPNNNITVWTAGTHTLGEFVVFKGSIYKCIAASTTADPTDSTAWTIRYYGVTYVDNTTNANTILGYIKVLGETIGTVLINDTSYMNLNAFGSIVVNGSYQIAANNPTDYFTIYSGNGILVTSDISDPSNKKMTIASTFTGGTITSLRGGNDSTATTVNQSNILLLFVDGGGITSSVAVDPNNPALYKITLDTSAVKQIALDAQTRVGVLEAINAGTRLTTLETFKTTALANYLYLNRVLNPPGHIYSAGTLGDYFPDTTNNILWTCINNSTGTDPTNIAWLPVLTSAPNPVYGNIGILYGLYGGLSVNYPISTSNINLEILGDSYVTLDLKLNGTKYLYALDSGPLKTYTDNLINAINGNIGILYGKYGGLSVNYTLSNKNINLEMYGDLYVLLDLKLTGNKYLYLIDSSPLKTYVDTQIGAILNIKTITGDTGSMSATLLNDTISIIGHRGISTTADSSNKILNIDCLSLCSNRVNTEPLSSTDVGVLGDYYIGANYIKFCYKSGTRGIAAWGKIKFETF